MSMRLVVEPLGGLTNRLMAVASLMRLAQWHGRDFCIAWRPTADCCAEFSQLFVNEVDQVTEDQMDDDCEFISIGHGREGWSRAPTISLSTSRHDMWVKTHGIITDVSERRGTFFQTDEQVACELWKFLWRLRPRAEILQAVDKLGIDGPNTFGLHVRRPFPSTVRLAEASHANERWRFTLVSDEFYIETAQRIMTRAPSARVLLSCNDGSSEECIRRHLGEDRLVMHQKASVDNGNDPQAIVDALIDLLALSQTFGVCRYDGSHFAWLASLYKLSPNLIIRRHNESTATDLLIVLYQPTGKAIYKIVGSDSDLDDFCSRRYNSLRCQTTHSPYGAV